MRILQMEMGLEKNWWFKPIRSPPFVIFHHRLILLSAREDIIIVID
jgi:hypothetical protein